MTSETKTPVDELEGRELDAAVAEEVFGKDLVDGLTVYKDWRDGPSINSPESNPNAHKQIEPDEIYELYSERTGFTAMSVSKAPIPRYSTDIASAWKVRQEMRNRNHWMLVSDTHNVYVRFTGDSGFGEAVSDTPPLAICRAALKAARSKDD